MTTSMVTVLDTVGRLGVRREYGARPAEGVDVERRY